MVEISSKATIKVIGVGGAGGNAINDMIDSQIIGVDFIAANTDSQDLEISSATKKIYLGERSTKGLGAGADPEKARIAAEESKEKIRQMLENTDMLFITAGMGGGTGTGASPVIAEVAREMEILTVGIVTRPFTFEGPQRKKNSDNGIEILKKYVDTLIAIPNDKLFELPNMNITLVNAFKEANNVLRAGVKGISELITKQGYINLDFADIRAIMKDSGMAMLGFGEAEGEDRAKIATDQALNSPLLEKSIEGSNKILLNITGGNDLELNEVNEISNIVISRAGVGNANLIFGTVIDEEVEGIKVSIVATDFDDEKLSRGSQSFFGNQANETSTMNRGTEFTNAREELLAETKPKFEEEEEEEEARFIVPPFFRATDDDI